MAPRKKQQQQDVTPQMLLSAYAGGYFPMAETRESEDLHWFHPERRGIIPLEHFHIPRSLQKTLRQTPFTFTANKAFDKVIAACAIPTPERPQTWINSRIISLYAELHRMGYAHSIECWQDHQLVGGLYGIAIGGAFCGESMFSRHPNASKAALVELVERLRKAGYVLLDTQYVNDHLKQFGCIEITRSQYMKRLEWALKLKPTSCF